MASRAELIIDIVVNSKGAAGIDQAASKVGKFQQGLSDMAAPAGVAAGAIIALGAATAKSASDMQQSFGGLEAVFGDNAGQMKTWAGDAAQTMGLSANAYAEGAAKIGAQLKNLGVPMDQIAGKTNDLMTTAADLAATYGGSTEEAVSALGAALRGEADPAERYGLALSKTAINAKMAADGTDKLTGKAKQQAQIAATLALVTEQSGGALGQFAREADSAAGSAQIASAEFENTKAALGTALLPLVSAVATQLGKMATYVSENAKVFQVLAVVIGSLSAAILIANAAMTVYGTVTAVATAITTAASAAALGTRIQLIALAVSEKAVAIATKLWAAAQWLINVALTANPIGIVIVLIVALVVAIVIAYQKSEKFRAIVQAVGAALVVAFKAVVAAVKAAAAWIVQAWQSVVAFLTNVFNVIKSTALSVWNAISSFVVGVVQKIIAIGKVLALPYVLAFQLIREVARIVFQVVRLGFQLIAAGAIIAANKIRKVLVAAFDKIKSAAAAVTSWIRSKFTAIAGPIAAVANKIKSTFTAALNAIKSAVTATANAIKSRFAAIAGPIVAVINRIKAAFSSAANSMKSTASSAASSIRSKFAAIAGPIIAVANRIKSAFTSALNKIKSAASSAGNALRSAFSGIAGAISRAIGAVQRLINALRRIKVPSIKLPSLGSASRSAVMPSANASLRAGPAVGLRAGSIGGSSLGGAMINITVNGALDPDAVARQIERVLTSAQRRRRGVTLRQRAVGAAVPV